MQPLLLRVGGGGGNETFDLGWHIKGIPPNRGYGIDAAAYQNYYIVVRLIKVATGIWGFRIELTLKYPGLMSIYTEYCTQAFALARHQSIRLGSS